MLFEESNLNGVSGEEKKPSAFTLPEPNQRSLEEISDEHAVRAAHEERELVLK